MEKYVLLKVWSFVFDLVYNANKIKYETFNFRHVIYIGLICELLKRKF